FAVPLFRLVDRLDAADAERRLRVAVGEQLDRGVILPVLFIEQRDADGTRGEHDLDALDRRRAGGIIDGLDGRRRKAKAILDRLARGIRTLFRARGDRDL